MRSPLLDLPGAVGADGIDRDVAAHYGSFNGEQRTLELLEEVGLVTHAHLGHGPPTYHAASDTHHLHLVCRDCGSVTETDVAVADPLVTRLAKDHGFDTDVAHFAVYGRCRECSP